MQASSPEPTDRPTASEPARRCAILAGGAGSRLGGEKASVELAGRPLISHVIEAARAAGLEPFVVAKRSSALPVIDCPVVDESETPRHPLVGVVLALQLYVEPIVIAPCDMPLLPPALLRALAQRPEPLAVLGTPRGPQPLLGRYSEQLLPRLRGLIGSDRPMRRITSDLGAVELDLGVLAADADPERALLNINSEQDLRRAEDLIAARG